MKKLVVLFALSAQPALAAGGKPFFSLGNTDFVVTIGFLVFVGILLYYKVPAMIGRLLDNRAAQIKGPADLKGAKIGVTAPGSSTNFFVNFLMARAGANPKDAAFVGVGTGLSAIAAMKRGRSAGLRLETKCRSTTTGVSSQMAPAFIRSSLMPGLPVTRTPR